MSELIGEALSELIEIAKLLHEAQECIEGANKAIEGKKPFLGSEKVEAQFKKLAACGKDLEALASQGLTVPKDKPVSMDDIANPKTRSQAAQKFKDNLRARDAFAADGKRILDALKDTEKDAQARSKAAHDISDVFKKLVEAPLPDIGTVGKTSYFGWYQQFEEAAGTLGNIASYAKRAQPRVTSDLKKVADETDNLRENLKTFGVR